MAQETTPLRASDEEVESGLGGYFCCRMLAPLSIQACDNHRHKLLYTAHCISGFGVVLTALSYIGAFAQGTILSYLSWATLHGPRGTVHTGVSYVCHDGPELDTVMSLLQGTAWKCAKWSEVDCTIAMPWQHSAEAQESYCGLCKSSSTGLKFTVFISVFTYFMFAKNTHARLMGRDSNWTKFIACFASLLAGMNFLVAIVAYWQGCVGPLDSNAGPGLICMTIAAVLKIGVGFIHLSLPVEHGPKKV